MLLPMLKPNKRLRAHQEENRARFKHFREAFAEFLIDRYFLKMEGTIILDEEGGK
jgi:hypothetical protein